MLYHVTHVFRKHMTEEHPDKRILVLDHSQLEAVASSDIQLVVDTQEEGGDITGENLYRE